MMASSQFSRPALTILALVLLAVGLLTAPERARAHSMYIENPRVDQVTVSAGSSATVPLYTNFAPSNVDWTIHTELGLANGDRYQNVYFYYYLLDRALITPTNIVGSYAVPVRDWVQVGPNVFGGTITSHVGGNMDLVLEIWNNRDNYAQTFNYYARARHP